MMNDRIRALAEQAGYLPDMFGIGHWDTPECKKFAELIITECIDCLVPLSRNHSMVGAAQDTIKKHFGAEE